MVPWLQDACRALRELSLLYDAADWDCHLQHHFAIMLGEDQPCRVSRHPLMPFLRHCLRPWPIKSPQIWSGLTSISFPWCHDWSRLCVQVT